MAILNFSVSRVVLAVLLGTTVIAAASIAGSIPLLDTLEIVLYTAVATAFAISFGALILRRLRNGSIGTQAGVLALSVVAGIVLGAWATARAMFLSEHDFAVLLVVLAAAAVASMVGALFLGRRINASIRPLLTAARQLGSSNATVAIDDIKSHEMLLLAAELRTTAERLHTAQARADSLEKSRRDLFAWLTSDVVAVSERIQALTAIDGSVNGAEISLEANRLRQTVEDLLELNA